MLYDLMGYVYLIQDINNEAYKIGVTRSNNGRRLKKLQTGNSTELKLLYIIESTYPFRLESMLHNKFKEQRILNEWYDMTKKDVEEFEELCEKYNKIIIGLKENPFFNKNGLK